MKTLTYISFLITMSFWACNKEKFLDEKPDASLAVPSSITHLQAILDHDASMNGALGYSPLFPGILELGTDNVWYLDKDYNNTIREDIKNVYTWHADPYPGMQLPDYNRPYAVTFRCNFILETLEKIERTVQNRIEYDQVKGSALFYRAFVYNALAMTFAPIFDPKSTNEANGLPLRLSSDVNEKVRMGSVQEVYSLMESDLTKAISLLPEEPLYKTRPSKRSAYALLSRVCLSKSDYKNAKLYADSALFINKELLDYSNYSTTTNYPFPRFNAEVIFNATMQQPGSSRVRIDSNLYNSYHIDDMRRYLFFKKSNRENTYRFYGNYDAQTYFFAGLANDELYLNRAEAAVRLDDSDAALKDLNDLLQTRWKKINGKSSYIPYHITEKNELLARILEERRKQLVWRGLRWQDLKRLNLNPQFAKVLKRTVNGKEIELLPNSDVYVYPIPSTVTDINPQLKNK
ncbi:MULTISPECIES: RagB/SusD family nutrient uptake outer membrane protein [Sphingobacterium]|uniref:RagB/SusD family nutrient uptake outer membrane protein n=1 Tax=Sphingobacterium TaxID=28453 RepID=UPI0013DCD5B1|nr:MULTISPECIES: RagB/SusD family nutrient uptake outer membrane protein [unclassified Sphingobacterium]